MYEDHRSLKATCAVTKWKSEQIQASNSWPRRYWRSALPIELTSQLEAGHWIGSLLLLLLFFIVSFFLRVYDKSTLGGPTML